MLYSTIPYYTRLNMLYYVFLHVIQREAPDYSVLPTSLEACMQTDYQMMEAETLASSLHFGKRGALCAIW